jgi:putative mRNA 3-end processing factor
LSTDYPIDVTAAGAVLLGPDIACDGFHYGCPVRVQSHVHHDHMAGFNTSKGNQDIVTSVETHELLLVEYNADLPYRQNLVPLAMDSPHSIGESRLMLSSTHHMLGAVQVLVEYDGARLGYSGDFQWPIEVPEVDALVVDSTYGSPASTRRFSQGLAEERLLELVLEHLKYGSVEIHAFRGTLHRAMQVLSGIVNCPLVGSQRLENELEVYRRFGYPMQRLAMTAEPGEKCVHFYGISDAKPVMHAGTTIKLSAFMAREDDPVLAYSDRAFSVSLSDHADFEGTIEYVRASGAKFVVTDNSRGRGIELASEIRARLGIEARPSSGKHQRSWGA